MGSRMEEVQAKKDRFDALADEQLIERAWEELGLLCGSDSRPKQWQMTIPVDFDVDSDVVFGEVLARFAKSIGYVHPKQTKGSK